MRIPVPADPKAALGASARGDRAVSDLDEDQRVARFRVGPGSHDPDGTGEVAADPQVASHVQKNAANFFAVQRRLTGPADDKPLGDSVQADRAVRETLGRACGRVELPGRRCHQRPVRDNSSLVGRRSCRAHEDQSRVRASARGSNAPPLFRIHESEHSRTSKSSGETIRDAGRRSCQRESSLAAS